MSAFEMVLWLIPSGFVFGLIIIGCSDAIVDLNRWLNERRKDEHREHEASNNDILPVSNLAEQGAKDASESGNCHLSSNEAGRLVRWENKESKGDEKRKGERGEPSDNVVGMGIR